MEPTKVIIENTVAAPVSAVWDFYTQPEHITKWNFASDDWQCPNAENDMRVGGKYRARMEAKDGSWGFDFEAVYNEIKEKEKFTYTIGDGRQVDVDFKSTGNNQTLVTVAFDAESQNPVEMQKNGWQAILDNFKKYAETH